MSYCSLCRNYSYDGWHACRQCYEKAQKTAEDLKPENEHLKAKVAFLKFSSPVDHDPSQSDTGPGATDVVLVATSEDEDGQSRRSATIPAHKAVLMSRSPVLKAMLENEMEEKRSGTIKISDVSYEALCAFVGYLYTAEAAVEEEVASELLEMAEKYQVKHLKADCEKFLVSNLNWDNSIINYVFAHRLSAMKLLQAALSFITDNMSNFIQREEYKELFKNDPDLVVEIYEAYLSKQLKAAPPPPPTPPPSRGCFFIRG